MTTTTPIPGFHAIVPAGGAGTRLWPLSRAARPKFLLDLDGSGRTLLQNTWQRLAPLASAENVLVVTGRAHAQAVCEQLPELASSNLLAEPSPRDSAAAICLAAAVVMARDPHAVVGSFAADQIVRRDDAFRTAVAEAVATARAGYIVTVGIEPSTPSTAFGYIRTSDALGVAGAPSALLVERFVEKPDAVTAARYVAEGRYRWNAGMFISRADVLLEQLRASRPKLHAGLLEIAAAWQTPERETVLDAVWPGLEKVAIDYAVAEPAAESGHVAVVPADLGWDDVGDFASLAELLGGAETAIKVLGDAAEVVSVDSEGIAVASSGRLVAVLGLNDVVVVDTPDALLVTTRERAQDVKAVVDHLRATARDHLL